MALLKAFKAVRPVPELASKVAALPYDVMDSEEARRKVEGNPYSFLHVDKAEVDLPPMINIYDKKVYEKARENLKRMIKENILLEDEKECIYIYRQTMGNHVQTGLVGCVSIDEYMNNVIKKHEETRKDKEKDRINHVYYCNANTGPIFLTYRAKEEIDDIVAEWTGEHSPVYDFDADDGIKHTAWVIDDDKAIAKIMEYFQSVDYLYIADGHHRAASAVEVGKVKRKEKPNYSGQEEFNYFLGVLFPHDELKIMDYNRVVKDLNGYSPGNILTEIEEKFVIEEYKGERGYRPEKKHLFGMYLDNKWYRLTPKEGIYNSHDSTDRLDVSILQNNILQPILGILDPRTDSRIDFVGGIRGLEELERRVNKGMAIAFSMFPTTVEDIMAIADESKVMPPKSTWFEPKLRSGLFIHELE